MFYNQGIARSVAECRAIDSKFGPQFNPLALPNKDTRTLEQIHADYEAGHEEAKRELGRRQEDRTPLQCLLPSEIDGTYAIILRKLFKCERNRQTVVERGAPKSPRRRLY